MTKKLNPKQAAFVVEYIEDTNATQAAIRVGYSEKTAYSQGSRLLRHVEVVNSTRELTEARGARAEFSQQRLMSNLDTLIERNMDTKLMVAFKALELMGKQLGVFNGYSVKEWPAPDLFSMPGSTEDEINAVTRSRFAHLLAEADA